MKMETLRERDEKLERLWAELEDVPVDPDTEKLEDDWFIFPHGTDKEDIWHWFDERHSKGVAHLLYGDGIDRTPELAQICYLKQLCEECDAEHCAFNPEGVCLFPLVGGRAPGLNDNGCNDFCYFELQAEGSLDAVVTDLSKDAYGTTQTKSFTTQERMAEIANAAIDSFGEMLNGRGLYDCLVGSLKMTDEEILAAGFTTLKEFMGGDVDA